MKKAFLLFLLLPLFTSCSFVTLERQIYPICMSVDLDEENHFRIGVQAPRADGGTNASYEIITATGDTFHDAVQVLSAATPYPLNFSQIRLCLISYSMAAKTELRPLLRSILEMPTMRPGCYVSVALGSALDVMQYQQPDFGMRMSTHLSLLLDRMRRNHLLPDSTLSYCVRELGDGRCDLLIGVSAVNRSLLPEEEKSTQHKEGGQTQGGGEGGGKASPAAVMGEPWSDAIVPSELLAGLLPHTSQNPVEYLGAAAVSDGRVSGLLTADEVQLALRLMEEAKLRTAREGEQLQLQLLVPAESPLADSKDAICDLMTTLQALHSDPLTFGCIASMGFWTDAAWEQYDFRSRYPTAEVVVEEW